MTLAQVKYHGASYAEIIEEEDHSMLSLLLQLRLSAKYIRRLKVWTPSTPMGSSVAVHMRSCSQVLADDFIHYTLKWRVRLMNGYGLADIVSACPSNLRGFLTRSNMQWLTMLHFPGNIQLSNRPEDLNDPSHQLRSTRSHSEPGRSRFADKHIE